MSKRFIYFHTAFFLILNKYPKSSERNTRQPRSCPDRLHQLLSFRLFGISPLLVRCSASPPLPSVTREEPARNRSSLSTSFQPVRGLIAVLCCRNWSRLFVLSFYLEKSLILPSSPARVFGSGDWSGYLQLGLLESSGR